MLEFDWVVVVQREGLRSWSVKTAVACVLSRCQSPSSGGEVASTEPRGCQTFPRPGHHPRGAVLWSLVPCRRRVSPRGADAPVVSVVLLVLFLLGLLLRLEQRRVPPREDRADVLALVEEGL